MTLSVKGECRICGMRFICVHERTYRDLTSRHIVEEHWDQPMDMPLVERLQ